MRAWLILDGNAPPLPTHPSFVRRRTPKLSYPTGKDFFGGTVGTIFSCRPAILVWIVDVDLAERTSNKLPRRPFELLEDWIRRDHIEQKRVDCNNDRVKPVEEPKLPYKH